MKNELKPEKRMRNNLPALAGNYDEKSFWKKLREKARDMGAAMVYKVLELYYAMIDRDTPLQVKLVIVLAAYKMAEAYVTPKVKARARKKTADLFGIEIFDEACAEDETEN